MPIDRALLFSFGWTAGMGACTAIAACSGTTFSLQMADGGGAESGMGSSSGTAMSSSSSGTGSSGGSSGTGTTSSSSSGGAGSGSSSGVTMSSGSSSGVTMSSGSSSGMAGSDAGSSSGPKDAAAHDAPALDSATKVSDARSDAAGDATTGGADGGACAACGTGSICVEDLTVGGALILPDDAGQCPNGRVVVPQSLGCSVPPTFHCAQVPGACTAGTPAVAHCVCVPSICPASYMCTDLTPTLTQCLQAVP
jgi:hypothetical protein